MIVTENTEFVVKVPYTDGFGECSICGNTGRAIREVERKEGDVIKAHETQNVKFLLEFLEQYGILVPRQSGCF